MEDTTNMKKRVLLAGLLACALGLGSVSAQQAGTTNSFGVGIILGEPTGVSAKLWLDRTSALDLAAGWNLREDNFYVHMDYLFHFYRIVLDGGARLPFYAGLGPKFDIDFQGDDTSLTAGLRVPVGFSYLFGGAPLDVFLEIAPTVLLYPSTDIDFGGGIGIRFYF